MELPPRLGLIRSRNPRYSSLHGRIDHERIDLLPEHVSKV